MLIAEKEIENLSMMQQGNGGLSKKGSASVASKKKASTLSRGTRKYAMMSKEKANILGSALSSRKKKSQEITTPVNPVTVTPIAKTKIAKTKKGKQAEHMKSMGKLWKK